MVYKCSRCEHEFHIEESDTFVKTVLPNCPSCGNNEVKKINQIDKSE